MVKRLTKSSKDKKLEGVCGGLGDYFNLDPTLIRISFVVLTILSGLFPGVVIYVALAIIMPRDVK